MITPIIYKNIRSQYILELITYLRNLGKLGYSFLKYISSNIDYEIIIKNLTSCHEDVVIEITSLLLMFSLIDQYRFDFIDVFIANYDDFTSELIEKYNTAARKFLCITL